MHEWHWPVAFSLMLCLQALLGLARWLWPEEVLSCCCASMALGPLRADLAQLSLSQAIKMVLGKVNCRTLEKTWHDQVYCSPQQAVVWFALSRTIIVLDCVLSVTCRSDKLPKAIKRIMICNSGRHFFVHQFCSAIKTNFHTIQLQVLCAVV